MLEAYRASVGNVFIIVDHFSCIMTINALSRVKFVHVTCTSYNYIIVDVLSPCFVALVVFVVTLPAVDNCERASSPPSLITIQLSHCYI